MRPNSPADYHGPDRRMRVSDPCWLLGPAAPSVSKLSRLLFFTDLRGTRLSISLASMLFGVLMLAHLSHDHAHYPMAIADHSAAHGVLFAILPPPAWALMFFVSGLGQLVSLFSDAHSPRVSATLSSIAMVLWLFAAISSAASPHSMAYASAAEIALALAAGWVWVRSGLCAIRHGNAEAVGNGG